MPLTRVTDRRRSRDRRLHNEHYNDVQRASRAQRLSSRAQQADRRSAVLFYRCFTERPTHGVPAHRSFQQGNSWWSRFHGVMKRCRWKAPAWSRTCEKCHAFLMDGEDASFCCNKGKWIAPPLPPLPPKLSNMVEHSTSKRLLSSQSRCLNNLFCFTAIGASKGFQHFNSAPASVAITGRTYHRLFDIADASHTLHWFLYDSLERDKKAKEFKVPSDWTRALNEDLQVVNPYVHNLRMFRTIPEPTPCALELADVGQNGDFAAILHAANSTAVNPRSIVIWRNRDEQPTFVPIFSRHYEPLQYPLLFPHGTAGWGLTPTTSGQYQNTLPLTQRQWYRSRLLTDPRFRIFGRLTCEYLCDMYSRVEEERLKFIHNSRETLATDHFDDAEHDGDEQTNISLPASFMGSRKWASEQTADSLALARTYGPPSLFITMTCNPDWPEIVAQLLPGQHATDSPVVVARAFKNRLHRLFHILRTKIGDITYLTSSNEFQKRGFPHSHIVIQVCSVHSHAQFPSNVQCKIRPELPIHEIDCIVKARLPQDNPSLQAKVQKFMTHNPNHLTREVSRCRKGNKCIYGFPHPITPRTSVNEDGRVLYRRSTERDRWIAPHIPELIDQLDCHIYVDIVFTVSIFTYLYKYLYKGPDHTSFHIPRPQDDPVDETKDYVEARYLSAHEAAWRILGFHITSKTPSVACLPVHLPDQNIPRFSGRSTTQQDTTSLLMRYFKRPPQHTFDNITYCDYFKDFVLYKWNDSDVLQPGQFLEERNGHCVRNKVCTRQVGCKVSRITMVSPTAGELFYLRCLLMRRAARSYSDLRTVEGTTYDTFHDAAIHFGIFTTENEAHYVMVEAVASFCTPHALRFLFARMILEGYPALPLWNEFKMHLAQDFVLSTHSEERGVDNALKAISDNVHDGGRSLTHFGLPEPLFRSPEVVIEQELYAPRTGALLLQARAQFRTMNDEQRTIFTTVVLTATSYSQLGHLCERPFFVEGKPGRGKTFVVDAICSQLRGQAFIVLIVGSSALAATLYEGGRTAHNVFQIPVLEVSRGAAFSHVLIIPFRRITSACSLL
jgi:hypothetical protein